MAMVVRSYRELRRLRNFSSDPADDVVFRWLLCLEDCTAFYDIGASIGLYGFAANHLHNCTSVFIEPYASSIETILKSVYIRDGWERFEVVQAGLADAPCYGRLYLHGPPKPGETKNSFVNRGIYTRGGRDADPVYATQWLPGVSLDQLVFEQHLPIPAYIKMDIDGYEAAGLRGGARLLRDRAVRSYAIEINGEENLAEVRDLMKSAGYVEIAHQAHTRDMSFLIGDWIFVRDDLRDLWEDFS